jgi:hypothetical protein
MGTPSYMRSVADRNVVMRRMTVYVSPGLTEKALHFAHGVLSDVSQNRQPLLPHIAFTKRQN